MRVYVFGSSRVLLDETDAEEPPLEVGARKPRSVLAALALHPGRPVSADLLADLVWAGEPPPAAHGALHAYISGLRKLLEPDRRRGAPSLLETTDHGYRLQITPEQVDAHQFAAQARAGERGLAPLATQLAAVAPPTALDQATVAGLVDRLDESLALWTGDPFADLPDHPDVLAERAALAGVRAAAEEARLLGLLALGEPAGVLAATEAILPSQPTRERLQAIHALALVRAGRQVDALAGLRQFRELLADDLGLDPGGELRELEQLILRQDPGLLAVLAPQDAPSPGPDPTAPAVPTVPPRPAPAVESRAAERAQLGELLTAATAGHAGFALIVGEPGIGKSWLVQQTIAEASARGLVVARGDCSQDDGAPPLWPWRAVLQALRIEVADLQSDSSPSPGRVAFETWERITAAVLEAARSTPLLLVFDDLHWADEATLRALRHLMVVTPPDARLVVLGTRRRHPEPTGALAAVGESFARRHALRLGLTGLDETEAAALVRSVARAELSDPQVHDWHERSAGNPFFLVELARLGSDTVPATVREVVAQRLAGLPDATQQALRVAAVVGGEFLVEAVAAATQADPDDVADLVEPARTAGLVRDDGAGGYAFVHALTHEAVYDDLPTRRRARLHAQLAYAFETDQALRALYAPEEIVAELARHWLLSGPSHADQAWRAAQAAATQARAAAAYRESMRLRAAAVAAHRTLPAARLEDRHRLLLELARDAAYGGRWVDVVGAAYEAMALGRTLQSPERLVEAAASLTRYCVWAPHEWGEVFEDSVSDLRWALRTLPESDSPARCTGMLSLASELYYDPTTTAERAALVDAGLAMARRLAEPALLAWATRAAWLASWSPEHTDRRIGWAREGLAAARTSADAAAEAVALVALATDELELGRVDAWTSLSTEAERIGVRERLPYVLLTINWVEMGLEAMRGDATALDARRRAVLDLVGQVAMPGGDLEGPETELVTRLWEPSDDGSSGPDLVAMADLIPLTRGIVHAMLARRGRVDLLGPELAQRPYDEAVSSWQTLIAYCFEAEAASWVGNVAVARRALDVITGYTGRIALAGASMVGGPVDGYVALALATVGDLAGARRHVETALVAAERWGWAGYRDLLADHRLRLDF